MGLSWTPASSSGPEYRQRAAENLNKGVAKYEAGLGASRLPVERAAGQAPH